MSVTVERFALEAVFVLQLNSAEAIRYIARNSKCDADTAVAAFNEIVRPKK